jgi:anti-anti-sigma factor
VRIVGEIDLSNAREVGAAIEAAVPPDLPDIVLDLSGTSYLDSAGIALLVRFGGRLRSRRQQVRIVALEGSAVRAVIELAGLSELLPMSATLEES